MRDIGTLRHFIKDQLGKFLSPELFIVILTTENDPLFWCCKEREITKLSNIQQNTRAQQRANGVQKNTVIVVDGRNLEEEELCISLGVITWEVADPDATIGSTLLILTVHVFVMIKVVEKAGLVAPKAN